MKLSNYKAHDLFAVLQAYITMLEVMNIEILKWDRMDDEEQEAELSMEDFDGLVCQKAQV